MYKYMEKYNMKVLIQCNSYYYRSYALRLIVRDFEKLSVNVFSAFSFFIENEFVITAVGANH